MTSQLHLFPSNSRNQLLPIAKMDEDRESVKSWTSCQSGMSDILTPKPLNIIKRDFNRLSTISLSSSVTTVGTSILCLSQYDSSPFEDDFSIDCRRAGKPSYDDDGSVNGYSATRVIPPIPSRDYRLNVPKTRRSDTTGTVTGTGTSAIRDAGYTSKISPRTTDSLSSLAESLSVLSHQGRRHMNTTQSGTQQPGRSFTVSRNPKIQRLRSFFANYVPTIKQASDPIINHAHRRIVSERPSDSNDAPAVGLIGLSNLPQARVTGRQASSTSGFLNRCLPGIDVSMSAGQSTRERRKRENPTLDGANENSGSAPAISAKAAVIRPSQNSRVAFEPIIKSQNNSSIPSDLESTIAAFPSPPSSGSVQSVVRASPNTDSSSSTSLDSSLTTPKEIPIMGVDLEVFLEKERVEKDGRKHLCVAIDINNVLLSNVDSHFSGEGSGRLDIVVVIDNSVFTSPAALIACCESAYFVVSNLELSRDRFGIFCTHGPNPGVQGIDSLLPFGSINLRQARQVLDSVVSNTKKAPQDYLKETITRARTVLESVFHGDEVYRKKYTTTGHVLVLTANAGSAPVEVYSEKHIQAHVICPSTLPWQGSQACTTYGWQLSQRNIHQSPSTIPTWQTDHDDVRKGLKELIAEARFSVVAGRMSDLKLSFTAGPHCSVDKIIGRVQFPRLAPGQVLTTLVGVRIGDVKAGPATLDKLPQVPRTSSGAVDLDKELDVILGDQMATILTAKLTYKHASFPEGSLCCITREVKLPTRDDCAPPNLVPSSPTSSTHQARGYSQEEVEKHLIYQIATTEDAASALNTLGKHFGPSKSRRHCPGYLRAVTEELKYQRRVLERFEIATVDNSSPTSSTPRTVERSSAPEVDIANHNPIDWYRPPPPSTNTFHPQNIERTPNTGQVRHKPSQETVDEAHVIWSDIRNQTRGPRRRLVKKQSFRNGQSDENLEQIRDTAVKNKRSVGNDTLHSLAFHSDRRIENVAPWL